MLCVSLAVFLLLLSCVHTNERPVTETRSSVPARLIVRDVRRSPCFTLFGGSYSHQEALLRIEGPVEARSAVWLPCYRRRCSAKHDHI